jgi:predicted nucleotidyltransferase
MASRLEATTASADLAPLQEVVRRIVASWAPTQIWLFGSRARGAAAPDSDWDLLVVVPDGVDDRDLDPVSAWKIGKDSGIRADIIPCRRTDFDEDRLTPNTLAFEAWTHGRIVYER